MLELAIHQEQSFEKQGRGIGLSNLHKQLQAFFGPSSGISLSKSTLGGLQVMLSLPIHTSELVTVPPILSKKGGTGAA